ncbi:MAG TPA: GTP-binding protein, partial [Pirellulales bacterium]|nr:GTP-binding protein [Pirellulales bacterium]
MPQHQVEDIRNIAFCGHGSAGKTTLVDKLLNKTGAVNQPASVDQGTSICDFDEEEKQHKYSIEASLVHFDYGGKYFQVIDTPGYPDFIGQTLGALRAVETAVIVINAHSGIEVNTRRVFQEAGKAGLGRMIVVSKMDLDNIDFPGLLENIQSMFGPACIPLNVPLGSGHDFRGVAGTLNPPADVSGALVDPAAIGTPLIESIIENDEEVMGRYFEGTPPTDVELSRLIVDAIANGSLVPIVCLSTKNDVGVKELLDALVLGALPPGRVVRKAKKEDGAEVTLASDPAGPLVAQVFKTRIDPFVQKLSYFRLYSGTLKKDETVAASTSRRGLKASQLLRVRANHTEAIESASAGEIVALAKAEDLHTNTTLGTMVMPPIVVPTPMVGLAVTPKSRGDEGKLSGALHKIVEEDLTLRLDRDPQT